MVSSAHVAGLEDVAFVVPMGGGSGRKLASRIVVANKGGSFARPSVSGAVWAGECALGKRFGRVPRLKLASTEQPVPCPHGCPTLPQPERGAVLELLLLLLQLLLGRNRGWLVIVGVLVVGPAPVRVAVVAARVVRGAGFVLGAALS